MCCCQVVFFYIQNKRSGGSLTAETFECPAQPNILQLCSTGQKRGTAGFKSLEKLAVLLQAVVSLSALQRCCAHPLQYARVSLLPSWSPAFLVADPCQRCSLAHWQRLQRVPVDGKETRCCVCECGLEGANCQA